MADTFVSFCRSSDTGAPVLSGSASSVIAVFDACLVNGYNAKTVQSIVRIGDVVIVTFSVAHGFAADGLTSIRISGCSPAAYNGDWKIFNVSTLAFSFTLTGNPATPAVGTITAKVVPLGWAKAFTGTNKASYQSSEVTGTRLFLRVDDNNPGANGYCSARLRGYESMADVDTGTAPFPTAAQMANGVAMLKSVTADATVRNWILVGDGFEFWFFYAPAGGANLNVYRAFHFGDFASELTSDPYGCLIYGDTSDSSLNSSVTVGSSSHVLSVSGVSGVIAGHYLARNYTQTGASVQASKLSEFGLTQEGTLGNHGLAYPAPTNSGLYIAPVIIGESAGVIRGRLAGIYNPLHAIPLGFGGVRADLDNLPGRTIFAVTTGSANYIATGETHVDLTGPWR